jgi:hypothetical protein
MNCGCGREIPQERLDLGFKVCVVCGEKIAQSKRPHGYISYGHKTAGSIVITSKAGLENYRKVSHRMNKGSHMGYASRLNSDFTHSKA